jgi:hypothetical protein
VKPTSALTVSILQNSLALSCIVQQFILIHRSQNQSRTRLFQMARSLFSGLAHGAPTVDGEPLLILTLAGGATLAFTFPEAQQCGQALAQAGMVTGSAASTEPHKSK